MKRMLAAVLSMVMLLSLCACGGSKEGAKLYEKYAHIIDRLEMEDYNGAIQEIAALSNAGREQEEHTPLTEALYDDWYSYSGNGNAKAPQTVTISPDGTAEVDGREMTLLMEHEDEFYLAAFLVEDGQQKYRVELNAEGGRVTRLIFQEVEVRGDSMSFDWLGEYVNDPMLPYLMLDWNELDVDEGMPDYVWFSVDSMSADNVQRDWVMISSGEGTITADVDGVYTASMELRGEKPVLTLTDNATGAVGTYYNYSWGYDHSWSEFIYPKAVAYLNECVEDLANGYTPGFWSHLEEESVDYSGNEAWKKLYEVFTQLGGYKDSAEIASRFTILADMYTGAEVVRVDNLGNQTEDTYESFKYNAQGQVTRGQSYEILRMYRVTNPYFFYDETGRITKVQLGSGDSVSAVITPAYDEQGRMVSAVAQYNTDSYDFSYTYDEAGRLVESVTYNNSPYRYHYTYSYNDAGLLEKVVCLYGYYDSDRKYDDRDTYEYTYDAQGYLIRRVATVERDSWNGGELTYNVSSVTTVDYTNDSKGRPVSASITVDSVDNKYASQTVTYTYQDLYFYE